MYAAAIFLPLLGAVLAGALAFAPAATKEAKHRIDRSAQWASCGTLALSALLSIPIFKDVVLDSQPRTVELFTWIDSGALEISWALKFDALTAVMVLVVSNVSALIHVYSVGYMHHDPG